MKILYISAFFWPHMGGIETLSLKYLPAMKERGYDFQVITSFAYRDTPAQEEINGISVLRYPFLKSISDRNLLQMQKCIRGIAEVKSTFKPDIIHIHMSAPISFYHIRTLAKSSAPTILTLHTCFGDFDASEDTVLGQTMRSATWTTMVSNAVMSEAVHVYPEISRRSSVVYNGMQYSNIDSAPLDYSTPIIIGVGRLIKEKGFDILVRAFKLLKTEYPQAKLILVGDGTERQNLEEQVLQGNLQDSVTFTGQIHPEMVPEFINQANIVVIPSRFNDPLPTVALEAGLLGRPIVASRMGGLEEIIQEGKTGFLIDGENPQKYADTISDLFTNPKDAIKMGAAATLRIQDTFGWDRYLNNYDYLYQQIAKGLRPNYDKPL